MRSILEKALIALLNEEREKADALFHDFILERSRQIHESLRQGEDFVLDESWEQEFAVEEGLTEDDLLDDESEEAVEEANDEEVEGDDVEATTDEVEASEEEEEEGSDEVADDQIEGETELEDRVTDLEAELQRLSAEFDALAGEEAELESDLADHEAEDAEMFASQADDEVDSDEVDPFGSDDEEVKEESFDALGESAEQVAGLKTVKVDMTTSKEQGGKTVKQNNKSPGMQPKLDDRAFKGEPVEIKAEEHKGFDREQAPSSKVMPKRTNTMAHGDSNLTAAKKAGAEKALINDLKADPKAQTSPLTPVGKQKK